MPLCFITGRAVFLQLFWCEPSVPCSPTTAHPNPPPPPQRGEELQRKEIRAFPILHWLLTPCVPLRGLIHPPTPPPHNPADALFSWKSAAATARRGTRHCGRFLGGADLPPCHMELTEHHSQHANDQNLTVEIYV